MMKKPKRPRLLRYCRDMAYDKQSNRGEIWNQVIDSLELSDKLKVKFNNYILDNS